MDPATDEDNHDSTDSTSLPANNDVKSEKQPANNDKSNRLRAKPDIPVMFSDSEDSLDGFGYYTKKRKKDSESEDDWDPRKGKAASPKKKVKTEKSPKKPRKAREPKTKTKREPKPKKEKGEKKPRKPRGKKAKEEVKEENSNDASDEPSNEPEPTERKEETEDDADGEADGENDTAEESNPASAEYSVPKPAWEQSELLSEMIQVDQRIAANILKLFENENTIPFIARYRRDLTGDMSPEDLRKAKDAFETIKSIQTKASSILKAINKTGKLTPHLASCIAGARSLVELEHLYAPYKTGGKKTKADAARQLGLEPAAMTLLHGSDYVALEPLLRDDVPGRATMWDVENNLSYIIADVISKDKAVLDHLRALLKNATTTIRIESSLSRTAKSGVKGATKGKQGAKSKPQNKSVDEGKFELYYKFSVPVRHIKPHQVLALNRGENQKVLSVKVTVPDWFTNKMRHFCRDKWLKTGYEYPQRHHLFEKSFQDAFTRLIHPLLARQIRSSLNQEAERAAIEVFAANLKKLLLTPPLRGVAIMGIDPGFQKGCKIAVISPSGAPLDTDVLDINNARSAGSKPPHQDPTAERLKHLLVKNRCEMIGLGNGKGCREAEEYLSHLIQRGWFSPLDVQYTIVSEQGASIYSCSSEASKEFPDLEPNIISAVSLARRVQDPLSEMVKVEPKHLGVGMYQHDVSEKQLNSTLDEVVSECVSFVGVHVNTASLSVLRRVAGLNKARATNIVEWREKNGAFTNRQQLRQVKGIGEKTFEQCAGFIRIQPPTSDDKTQPMSKKTSVWKPGSSMETEFNPLDQTWIHPESYNIAYRFIRKCGVDKRDLGSPSFIAAVDRTVRENGVASLSRELNTSEVVLQMIAEGLQKPLDHDIRSELSKPLFRRGVTSLQDLTVGTVLTGRVQNVTHFGAFVDIGVGKDGLIHASKFHSNNPQLGDRVEVRVSNIELERKRIQLELIGIL